MAWNIIRILIVVFLLYILSAFMGAVESPWLSRLWKEPLWQDMAPLSEARSVGRARIITEDNTSPHFLKTELDGKAYFVLFYGDWCGVCSRKLPYFVEKAQELKDAGAPLLLIGDRRSRPGAWKRWINTDIDISAVQAVIDIDRTIFAASELKGVPSYSILNSKHELTATFYALNPHHEDLIRSISQLTNLAQ